MLGDAVELKGADASCKRGGCDWGWTIEEHAGVVSMPTEFDLQGDELKPGRVGGALSKKV